MSGELVLDTVRLVDGHLLHVFQGDPEWEVWLNTEDTLFSGLCVGTGPTRDAAIAVAVRVCEAVTEELQTPAGPLSSAG